MSNQDKEGTAGRWAEALAWYTTMRAAEEKQLTSKVAGAWQDWYADPQNRRAFDDVSRLLAERDVYKERPRPSKAELEADLYDTSVPIAQWLNTHQTSKAREQRPGAGKWWWVSGGLAAAAVLALVVFSLRWFGSVGGHSAPIVYQTAVGGLKQVHLDDGSTITLGGQTKLLVAFSAQRRSVNLIQGQAWFKVAHDPSWPFIVAAGDGTIEDVGTAFLVTRESDRVVVTVTEGVVQISRRSSLSVPRGRNPAPTARPDLAPIRVGRGEELAFGDSGALGVIKPADTGAATAWTHGRLTFDDQPLRYVIETVDRYSSRRIVVSPDAGALRFSGIVFDDEIDDWLESLKAIFPITIKEKGATVRIDMRSQTSTAR
ncbi:MAG: FecR family protein [Steroidobacteraceae bacterium]